MRAEGGAHLHIVNALRLPELTKKTKPEGCVPPLRSGPLAALRFGFLGQLWQAESEHPPLGALIFITLDTAVQTWIKTICQLIVIFLGLPPDPSQLLCYVILGQTLPPFLHNVINMDHLLHIMKIKIFTFQFPSD